MAVLENIHDASAFEALVRSELPRLLEAWSGVPAEDRSTGALSESGRARPDVDVVLHWAGHRLLVEVKSGSRVAQVETALERLRQHVAMFGADDCPLVVVPHMGDVGEELCAHARVSWADLSGNAEIALGPIRIHRRGEPNRFRIQASDPSPFSPKASRVARALLRDPHRWWKQEQLIQGSGLSRGYVSRVVSRLERRELVVRDAAYRLRPRDPGLLLDSWREAYVPRAGVHLVGHAPARSGQELAQAVASQLKASRSEYCLTALAAAWRHAPMAMFRAVHVYVRGRPPDAVPLALGFRQGEKGANLHLIVTGDDAVWDGSRDVDGAVCASPVQTYLDLKGMEERAEEAASHLREQSLVWDAP